MARYADDAKDQVRAAVDFVDLVGSRVELRKAGAMRYEGLCPFHEERTPSFGINPVEKVYYCFGCQAKGDLFTWVQETEGVGFKEALEILAERYNVPLERADEDPRAAERRAREKRLMALLERAAAYYVRQLWESAEASDARAYLADRGLDEGTARAYRVGYSPGAWDKLVAASQRAGFTAAELLAVGLAQRSRGSSGLIDRFRGRLMFPWADARGRVLGFGARALSEDQQPKYLNTSETDVFHKGRQVYGADLARVPAAKAGSVVLVEGYTDVLALHQAGVGHVVGQQGTALTPEQAAALTRLAPRVVLCLDADSAGREAMVKAAGVLRAVRRAESRRPGDAAPALDLRVAELPSGSDPAEVVQRDGAEALRALLDGAVPFARWQVEYALARGDTGSPEGREALLQEVHAVIGPLSEGIVRQELIRTVADRLALSDALLASTFSKPVPRPRDPSLPAAPPPARPRPVPPSGVDDEAAALEALIGADPGRDDGPPADPALRALDRRAEEELAFLALCIALPAEGARRLGELDLDAQFAGGAARRAAEHLRTHAASPTTDLPPDDEALAGLMAELVVRAGRFDDARPDDLDTWTLRLDLARVNRAISTATATGGPVFELAQERQRILGELRKLFT
jgi:DNA primase